MKTRGTTCLWCRLNSRVAQMACVLAQMAVKRPMHLSSMHSPVCRGDFGRLGHGDCSDVFLPQPIKDISGLEIVEVACGDTHTVAISAEGRLYSFGRNQNGQLGLGTSHDALSPSLIEALKVNWQAT